VEATLHLLPTLWFRNTWSWGRSGEGYWPTPRVAAGEGAIVAEQASLGRFQLTFDGQPELLFTENETNVERLFGAPNASQHVKDAFHEYVVRDRKDAVNPDRTGTKAALYYRCEIPTRGETTVRLRLCADENKQEIASSVSFDRIFSDRIREADEFYATRIPATLTSEEQAVVRQAYAGLLWSKQFFHFSVKDWLDGDPAQPPPPPGRRNGRNSEWLHLYNRDVISMPDKWEYPWYAAWDLAFHLTAFARIDPQFAKDQLVLFLREWFMHPNGQIPAYEFAFSYVNPPVQAWAAWRLYKMTGAKGARDRVFLARVFEKLNLNFTWWVNRKDAKGNNLFGGGFLGLDNIGVFDRSRPLPDGGTLEQADGTSWMAFYCATMLSIALELAQDNPAYEDMASKYFEHFVAIADAMNELGGSGLWADDDGFYYDQLHVDGKVVPLRIRSLVGLIPLLACEILEEDHIKRFPGFAKRMRWFLVNRSDLAHSITYAEMGHGHRLLAVPTRQRLERVLCYMLDENEFLSPHGLRSVSRVHAKHPYVFSEGGQEYRVDYVPGESATGLFGGNSNWRGPVWFPINYLIIEALERYHHFYGDSLRVECPTGSGRMMNLGEVASELSRRLAGIFLPDGEGRRPCHGADPRFAADPFWRDLLLFHEYFHGDTGRGLGASHQTGWTALVVRCFEDLARTRFDQTRITHGKAPLPEERNIVN
jgi:hypothetical protein